MMEIKKKRDLKLGEFKIIIYLQQELDNRFVLKVSNK